MRICVKSLARKTKSGLANRCSVAEVRKRLPNVTDKDPVIYQWWFRADAVSNLLRQIGEDSQKPGIVRERIRGKVYLALYVGKGKSCRERFSWHIRQHHDERTVRHGFLSTLRQTLCGLLGVNAVGGEEAVNSFMDKYCVLEWTCYPGISPADLGKLEIERISAGYFPLNIQGNPNVSAEIRWELRRRRSAAKCGRFPQKPAR